MADLITPVDPDPPVVVPPFDDAKVWWKSRTIWGTLIAGASGIISLASGHIITPQNQSMLTDNTLILVNSISSIVTIVAAVLAWWGRIKAKKSISKNIILPVNFKLLGKKEN